MTFFSQTYSIEFVITKDHIEVGKGINRVSYSDNANMDINILTTILDCIKYCENPF